MSTSARVKPKPRSNSAELTNLDLNNLTFRKIRGIGYKAKLVLLAIINHRDPHDNTCYPSLPRLAEVCDMSEHGVTRALEVLLKEGRQFVARVPGTGRCGRVSTYMVTVDSEGNPDPSKVPQRKTKPRVKTTDATPVDLWAGHGMTEKEAERVFDAWVKTFRMGPGYTFTDERREAIKARAKEGTTCMESLVALRGYRVAKDIYIPSQDKTRGEIPAMNDFCLIFRDDTKMRQFFQEAKADMKRKGLYLSDDRKTVVDKDGDPIGVA